MKSRSLIPLSIRDWPKEILTDRKQDKEPKLQRKHFKTACWNHYGRQTIELD